MAAINESAGWARGCSSPRNNSAASRDTSRFRCFLRSCTHLFLVTQLLPNEKRRPKVSYSRAATFQRKCGRFPLTRTKYQLTRDKVRLQSQLESLLEECQVKLSSVVSDLLGASGQRILRAMAQGETDPARLAQLGDKRLRASDAELMDALSGQPEGIHRKLLALYLTRLDLIESQMASLDKLIA